MDGVNDGEDNREGNNGEGPELGGANVGGRTPSRVRTTISAKVADAVFRDLATGVVSPRPPEMDNEITEARKEKIYLKLS